MTVENVQRLLLELLMRLPLEYRPGAGALMRSAAQQMDLWVPLAVTALVCVAVASISWWWDFSRSN